MPRKLYNGFAWETIYDVKIVKNLHNHKKNKTFKNLFNQQKLELLIILVLTTFCNKINHCAVIKKPILLYIMIKS